MILPEASCHACEAAVNWAEQFCLRTTFHVVRHKLRVPTKRPRNRPTKISFTYVRDGVRANAISPISDYPAEWLLPSYGPPELLLPSPPQRSRLLTFNTSPLLGDLLDQHQVEVLGDDRTQQVSALSASVTDRFEVPKTDIYRFAVMLAKIAHSYAVAELGTGAFHPYLRDSIRSKGQHPLHLLVGGGVAPSEGTDDLHNLKLERCEISGRKSYKVDIALFSRFRFPKYTVLVGADTCERRNLPLPMLRAGSGARAAFATVVGLAESIKPEDGPFDYLCSLCRSVIVAGPKLREDLIFRCGRCGTENVTVPDQQPWGLPYGSKDSRPPFEMSPREIWIRDDPFIRQ